MDEESQKQFSVRGATGGLMAHWPPTRLGFRALLFQNLNQIFVYV